MGTKGMKRETRVEWRHYDIHGALSEWELVDEWLENWVLAQHPSSTRTVERYVTEWAVVDEGEQ